MLIFVCEQASNNEVVTRISALITFLANILEYENKIF